MVVLSRPPENGSDALRGGKGKRKSCVLSSKAERKSGDAKRRVKTCMLGRGPCWRGSLENLSGTTGTNFHLGKGTLLH